MIGASFTSRDHGAKIKCGKLNTSVIFHGLFGFYTTKCAN